MGRVMKRALDVERVDRALKRAARDASTVDGNRSGRFLPARYSERYISVYRLLGISSPQHDLSIEIARVASPDLSFVLTNKIDDFFSLYDERELVGRELFPRIFGDSLKRGNGFTDEQLRQQSVARRNLLKGSVFLVVAVREEQIKNSIPVVVLPSGFRATLKGEVKAQAPAIGRHLERVLASIVLASHEGWSAQVEEVFKFSYFESEVGNLIHLFEMELGAVSLRVSGQLTDGDIHEISRLFETLSQREADLATPIKIYAESLRAAEVDLRGALAVWAALEIFLNKVFLQYEKEWDDKIRQSMPATGGKYFESQKRLTKGKTTLRDKFVIIASLLSPDDAGADIVSFEKAKNSRDAFFHALEAFPERRLASNLFRKYLKLHLRRVDNARTN